MPSKVAPAGARRGAPRRPNQQRRAGAAPQRPGVNRVVASPLALVATALAALSVAVVGVDWVQGHLALRFGIVFVEVALGLPCLWVIARRAPVGDRLRWQRIAALSGFAAGAWAALCAAVSGHPGVSWLGQWPDGTGALFILALPCAWAIGTSAGREERGWILRALQAGVGLNGVVALAQILAGFGLFEGRATGAWSNPVYLGGFLAGGVWLFVDDARRDWRWTAGIALASCGVELSGSRFALMLLAVAAVGFVVAFKPRAAGALVASVVVGLLLGWTAAHSVGSANSHRVETGTARALSAGSEGVRPRLEMWAASAQAVASRPITGSGPGLFVAATSERRTLAMARSEGPDRLFLQAHDILIEAAVTTGLPGALLLALFLLAVVVRSGWRSPLAGFGVLALLGHLVEPNHAALTPVALLALGAAAAPAVAAGVEVAAGAVLGLAALVGTIALAVGARSAAAVAPNPEQARKNAATARAVLGFWAVPYERSEKVEEFVAARTHDRNGYVAALRWQQEATRVEPYLSETWGKAAVLEYAVGDVAAAEADLRRALRDDPWSVAGLRTLATILAREGHADQALPLVDRALRAAPGDASLRDLRAKIEAAIKSGPALPDGH